MIDFDLISDTFINIAREAVGSQLSEIGPTGSEFPAVILAEEDGPTPDYPYITLSLIEVGETFGWKLAEGLELPSETPYVDTHYRLTYRYRVYGGDSTAIAQQLEGYFRLDRVLGDIYNATDGKLETTTRTLRVPTRKPSEYVEQAFFDVTFNINDRYLDTATGVFDRVILDGELARDADDPNPLPIDIDVGPIV